MSVINVLSYLFYTRFIFVTEDGRYAPVRFRLFSSALCDRECFGSACPRRDSANVVLCSQIDEELCSCSAHLCQPFSTFCCVGRTQSYATFIGHRSWADRPGDSFLFNLEARSSIFIADRQVINIVIKTCRASPWLAHFDLMGSSFPPFFLVLAAEGIPPVFRVTFLAEQESLSPATSTVFKLARFLTREVCLSVAGTIDHTIDSVLYCIMSICNIRNRVEVSRSVFDETLERVPGLRLKS